MVISSCYRSINYSLQLVIIFYMSVNSPDGIIIFLLIWQSQAMAKMQLEAQCDVTETASHIEATLKPGGTNNPELNTLF